VKQPAYVNLIARLVESGVIPRGKVVHVDVLHDADCGMLAGAGICSCKPIVTIRGAAA
jgi:hypothetical protein